LLRIHRGTLLKAALPAALSTAALLMAAGGSQAAFASPAATSTAATAGVTSGALLRGVQYTSGGAITDSIVMRSRSGTVRRIEAQHAFAKLEKLVGSSLR